MVDGVVVSLPLAAEVAGEVAVGVCVDDFPIEGMDISISDRLTLLLRSLRNRSHFLDILPGVSGNWRSQVRW